jgi:hypothetical protein
MQWSTLKRGCGLKIISNVLKNWKWKGETDMTRFEVAKVAGWTSWIDIQLIGVVVYDAKQERKLTDHTLFIFRSVDIAFS